MKDASLSSFPTALIGYTGFVGSNLLRQKPFDALYASRNIADIASRSFGRVVCAGVQAKKWWANLHPQEDWAGIERLLGPLRTVAAREMILISTIDVYARPKGVDEESAIGGEPHHAYGAHRAEVERVVRAHFPEALIVRLPGLFGWGLKKNVIHDLLHRHEVEKINPAGVFQYYPLNRLVADIEQALDAGIRVLNLATEPLGTAEIASAFFPEIELGPARDFQADYDMRSRYAAAWGGRGGYLLDRSTVWAELEKFIREQKSELAKLAEKGGEA